MPKVGRRKKAPEGWEDIEPTIRELEKKFREGTHSTSISIESPLPYRSLVWNLCHFLMWILTFAFV
jgi:hypothetical protein